MKNSIFDKTEKGREEIATRRHHLAPRLRTLLVLVDGKQTGEELLQKVAGIGLSEDSLSELAAAGFIHEVAELPDRQAFAPASPPAPATTRPEPAKAALPEGQTQFQAIYHFYNETVKSTIGLRGYGLQLKVEKAGSIEEFRRLRQPYVEAVLKAKGPELARSLRDRLDQLLYFGETPPALPPIVDGH